MAENVENATFEILKSIQASISELRRDMNERFDTFSAEARKDRRSINGLMTLLQAASGDFDERIDRVSLLGDRTG